MDIRKFFNQQPKNLDEKQLKTNAEVKKKGEKRKIIENDFISSDDENVVIKRSKNLESKKIIKNQEKSNNKKINQSKEDFSLESSPKKKKLNITENKRDLKKNEKSLSQKSHLTESKSSSPKTKKNDGGFVKENIVVSPRSNSKVTNAKSKSKSSNKSFDKSPIQSPNKSKKKTQIKSSQKSPVKSSQKSPKSSLSPVTIVPNKRIKPTENDEREQVIFKKDNIDDMLVNKYKPKNISQIIGQGGNSSCAKKLKFWLENWFKNKDVKPTFNKFKSKGNDDGAGYKAALLSGLPGIGKTTTAHLVAKELAFEAIEFNASDTRNKSNMDQYIQTLISNHTLGKYFNKTTSCFEINKKNVLIMDEVDGMGGNADRGGINVLIQFIKKTQQPIICICNDRNDTKIRSLSNYCFDLRFSKPRTEQIKAAILSICFKEKISIDSNTLNEIIESSNHDIRQVLNYVSLFSSNKEKINKMANEKKIKNIKLGPFDAVKKMFTCGAEYDQMSFKDKSDLFFYDYSLIPLFAFENYLNCKVVKADIFKTLDLVSKSSLAICIGDIIEKQIRSSQNWSLLPMQAAFSTVMPGYYMNGFFKGMIQFPSLLGKISTINKKDRLLQELKLHMNLCISGDKTSLMLDYLLPLRNKLVNPLLKNDINSSIQTLSYYNLLKTDLDSILELTTWNNEKNPFTQVDSKVKSALTRTYNKTKILLPFTTNNEITKVLKNNSKMNKNSKTNDAFENEEMEVEELEEGDQEFNYVEM